MPVLIHTICRRAGRPCCAPAPQFVSAAAGRGGFPALPSDPGWENSRLYGRGEAVSVQQVGFSPAPQNRRPLRVWGGCQVPPQKRRVRRVRGAGLVCLSPRPR